MRIVLKKYFLIFVFVFLGIQVHSQEIILPVKKKPDKNDYGEILKQKLDFKCDTLSLNKAIEPLKKSSDPGYQILYKILKADGLANCLDRVTGNSNRLFESALNQAKETGPEFETVANIYYAKYLYRFRNIEKALPYFLQADYLLEKNPTAKQIRPQDSYKWIGYYYGTIGDRGAAVKSLERSRELSKNRKSEYAGILDALGLHYYEAGDIRKAEIYFNQAKKIAESVNDEFRYAKALGNLALIYAKRGQTKAAKQLILEDIEISERLSEEQNTMYAYTELGEVFLQEKNFNDAEKALAKAAEIAKTKSYFAINAIKIEKLRTEVFKNLNKKDAELESFKNITELEKQLRQTDGEYALNNANLLNQKAKLQKANTEAHYEKERAILLRKVYLVMLFFALTLAGFIYANSRKVIRNRELRYKQKVLGMEMEKLKFEQKLHETQENLDNQIEYLKNKNTQITRLKAEIEKVKNSKSYYLEEQQGHLNALLESHLMTDENWENFRKEFVKVYPDFYQTLQKEFHDLQGAGLRIVLLKKMGFNNVEISGLLGVTVDAIKKSNQRMKKKLGDRYEELSEIIQRP